MTRVLLILAVATLAGCRGGPADRPPDTRLDEPAWSGFNGGPGVQPVDLGHRHFRGDGIPTDTWTNNPATARTP